MLKPLQTSSQTVNVAAKNSQLSLGSSVNKLNSFGCRGGGFKDDKSYKTTGLFSNLFEVSGLRLFPKAEAGTQSLRATSPPRKGVSKNTLIPHSTEVEFLYRVLNSERKVLHCKPIHV